jgi:hypothetical protein
MGLTAVFEALVADPFSIGAMGLIATLFLAGFFALRRHEARVGAHTEQLRSQFDEVLLDAAAIGPSNRTPSPLLRTLTLGRAGRAPGGDARWCADADAWRTIEHNAITLLDGEHPLGRLFCGAARHLTGVALVATFLLIGIVLARDVPDAIGTPLAADGVISTSNAALRHAVQLIGSKFLISALGLLLSLIYSGLESRTAATISGQIHTLHRDFADRFTTREELQTEAVVGAITKLEAPLGYLSSAQVSLQSVAVSASEAPAAIANAVQAALEPVLQARFATAVHALNTHHTSESDATIAALEKAERAIVSGLTAVRDTVQKQAKSDLEALLKQLRDVVNTGYDEEAGRLRAALAELTSAIPLLDERLRQLVSDVDGTLGRQAELIIERETALGDRITASLATVAGQLEAVGERAEGYARSAEKMLDDVVALSAAHLEVIEKALAERAAGSIAHLATLGEKAAKAANDAVAKATESRFKAIEKKFQEETKSFSAGLGSTSKAFGSMALETVEATAATLKQAVSDMTGAAEMMQRTHADAARTLNEASSTLVAVSAPSAAVAEENRALQAAAKETVAEFRAAALALKSTLMQATAFETKALETQRQFVEDIIPQSVEKHRLAIEASVAQHQKHMLQLVERVEKATKATGERIADQVARLADVIDSYESDDDDGEGQPAPAVPPATTP